MNIKLPVMLSRIPLIIMFSLVTVFSSNAQQLLKSQPFSLRTPFLEPDNRKLTLAAGNDEFIMLVKAKGSLKGKSDYMLEWRKEDLSLKWNKLLRISDEENFLTMKMNASELMVFSVIHDMKRKESTLHVRLFDRNTGNITGKRRLMKQKLMNTYEAYNKGKLRQHLEEYIEAGCYKGFVTPFEYRFYLNFSPDGSKLIAYYYDDSKENLLAHAKIFDAALNEIHRAQLPVDKGYFSEGFYVNNEGVIYILNTDDKGNVAMIRYDLRSKQTDFLKWSAGHSNRSDYTFRFAGANQVYVACLSEKAGKLNGLLMGLFNFEAEEVQASVYHTFSHSFMHRLDSAVRRERGERASWTNFDLTDFHITEEGEKLLVLEKRNLISTSIDYQPGKPVDLLDWKERKGSVESGEVLLFVFDERDRLKWENFIIKDQSNIAADGLNTLGVEWDWHHAHGLQVIHGYSDNPVKGMNHLLAYVFDPATGQLVRRMELPFEDKYGYIRPYTYWNSKGELVVGARKNLTGRSSLLMKFSLQEETALENE